MNADNRRLREIQQEIKAYNHLLVESGSISDCLIYKGKLECLEKEEMEILKRCDVI